MREEGSVSQPCLNADLSRAEPLSLHSAAHYFIQGQVVPAPSNVSVKHVCKCACTIACTYAMSFNEIVRNVCPSRLAAVRENAQKPQRLTHTTRTARYLGNHVKRRSTDAHSSVPFVKLMFRFTTYLLQWMRACPLINQNSAEYFHEYSAEDKHSSG